MVELPAVTDLIPHRGRWLLIERLVTVDLAAGTLTALGRFDLAFAEGHFPDGAVVPGVALLEGLAQAMGCLARLSEPDADGTPFLAAFDQVRFRAPVLPPAEVLFQVTIRERRMGLTLGAGEARWEGRRVCAARLTGGRRPG